MSKVGADIAVHQNNLAVVQGGFEFRLGFEAVAGIEHGSEVRVHTFERAEVAVEKLADHLAEPGVVLWKAGGKDGVATRFEAERQEFDLRALATAIDTLDGDEFSGSGHFLNATADRIAAKSQSNPRDSALQCHAC